MVAVYDIQVRNALYTYKIALVGYPISIQRRKIKVKRLRSFLQALSRNVDAYPTCNSKRLGQFFDIDGNLIFPNLKQGNYEDESGTQWRMSFFRISTNKVKIYRLYQSASIDESKLKKKMFIENNNLRINTENKHMSTNKKVIRLTESELRNIIAESVEMILTEGKYVNNKQGFKKRKSGRLVPTEELFQHIENNPNLKTDQEKDEAEHTAINKHVERQNNKTFVDPLLQKHNERRRELTGRAVRDNKLNPFGEINK